MAYDAMERDPMSGEQQSAASPLRKPALPRVPAGAMAGLLIGAALLVVYLVYVQPGSGLQTSWRSATARTGDVKIEVTEAGALRSSRAVTYHSPFKDRTVRISYLVEEGTKVEAGQTILEFDSQELIGQQHRKKLELQELASQHGGGLEELSLLQIEKAQKINEFDNRIELAGLEMDNIENASGPLSLTELRSMVAQAQRDEETARKRHEDFKPLLEAGFVTRAEFEKARKEFLNAEERLKLATMKLASYEAYGLPMERKKARSAHDGVLDEKRKYLEAFSHRESRMQAGLSNLQARMAAIEQACNSLLNDIASCTVKAETPGLVIYKKIHVSGQERKVQVGDEVWSSQGIVVIPDISQMLLDLRIRETDLHKIETGQHAVVRLEAYPDARFTATVELIGALASEQPGEPGERFFEITLRIHESDPRLRPGMTARATIEARGARGVLTIPAQALIRSSDGGYKVRLGTSSGVTFRQVVPGLSNADVVEITRGLEEGEEVLYP